MGHALQDRFRGALLGTLVGDALGMPVEGWSAAAIRDRVGAVREMLDAHRGAGTDPSFRSSTRRTLTIPASCPLRRYP